MTPEQRQNIWEWYRQGCTPEAIADFTGLSCKSVKGVIYRMKRAPKDKQMNMTDHVAELMSQEFNNKQIAQQLGVSIVTVQNAVKGIKRTLGPQAR